MTALAIFVKTPGLSRIKTRLAAGVGDSHALEFHRRSAAAVGAVARAAMPTIAPYWAVAECEGLQDPHWQALPTLWQGDGPLGARLDKVYSELLQKHGSVLLVGADAPQITASLLLRAAQTVRTQGTPYAIGPARDGGFWLFGGSIPVPSQIWQSVPYSQSDTATRLIGALEPHGAIGWLPTLTDIDRAEDLPELLAALSGLDVSVPEQASLKGWLRSLPGAPSCPAMMAGS